jgi:hypothetical protein
MYDNEQITVPNPADAASQLRKGNVAVHCRPVPVKAVYRALKNGKTKSVIEY